MYENKNNPHNLKRNLRYYYLYANYIKRSSVILNKYVIYVDKFKIS